MIGPRRAGKSTVLYQLMDELEKQGISQEAMLHINFEDPKLASNLTLDGVDSLFDTYRTLVYPSGKAYLFLDEIQNIPEWERWIQARVQTENVKIFITGSSAKLMSRELATLLTGRHLSFEILPLSFGEFLRFKQIPRTRVASAPIKNALEEYLKWGSFPKVVLADTEQYKRDILLEYYDDILFKDIVVRHNIRDAMQLRSLVGHLMSQTGKLLSFQRLANIMQVSNDLSIHYCNYAEEAYLVEFLSFYSMKASIRQRHPHKIHALDLGLRNVVSFSQSEDSGRLIETAVYDALRRSYGDKLFYWQEEGEIDFIVQQGTEVTHVYQVVSDGLDDPDILNRECRSLHNAAKQFPKAECALIVKKLSKKMPKLPFKIILLWQFLLD
ncbi:MAG: ATP-binding protein [Parachlamydia sp.]|nr:ATP-binding protein [Parachlamydia sp.]